MATKESRLRQELSALPAMQLLRAGPELR